MYSGKREISIDEQYDIKMTVHGSIVDDTGGLRVIQYFAYVGGLVKLAYEIMQEREAYLMAAVVGFVENEKHSIQMERDLEEVKEKKIFATDMVTKKSSFLLVYRLMMLLEDEDGFTMEDYKNRTFRDDAQEEGTRLSGNKKMFNEYACAGLSYLHERFAPIDRIEDKIDELYSYIHETACRLGMSEQENLPDFIPEFR